MGICGLFLFHLTKAVLRSLFWRARIVFISSEFSIKIMVGLIERNVCLFCLEYFFCIHYALLEMSISDNGLNRF